MKYTTWKDDSIGYSSFWLDKKTYEDASSANLSAMVNIQEAIGNFVKILTRKNIHVGYGTSRSYTDGKSVILASTKDKDFDSTCGLALHEASHIVHTQFEETTVKEKDYITEWYHDPNTKKVITLFKGRDWENGQAARKILHDFVNWIEDRRIDYLTKRDCPGYVAYYTAMYNKYFFQKMTGDILKSKKARNPRNIQDYMFRIINFQHPASDLDAMPGLREIYNVIDYINISRLSSTGDVFDVAVKAFEILMKYHSLAVETQPAPEKKKKDSKPNKKKESNKNESKGDDEEDSGEDESNESDKDENDSDGSDEDDEESKGSGKGTDDSDESEDNDEDSNGTSGEADDGDSNSELSDDEIEAQMAAHLKDLEESGDLDENTDPRVSTAIKEQEKFLEGEVKKSNVSTGLSDVLGLFKMGTAKLHITSATDIFGSPFKYKVLVLEHIPEEFITKRNETDAMHPSHHSNIWSNFLDPYKSDNWQYSNDKAIARGLQLGDQLGRKLKIRGESRTLMTPHQKSGRVDKRRLAFAGFGEEDIFFKSGINQYGNTHIHVSIDGSASMRGSRWENALQTAIAIAKAATFTPNISVVLTLRSNVEYNKENNYPLTVVIYDSRKDKFSELVAIAQYLAPNGGNTPEMLLFDAERAMMPAAHHGLDCYYISLTDGGPNYNKTQSIDGNTKRLTLDASYNQSPDNNTLFINIYEYAKSELKKFIHKGIVPASYYISELEANDIEIFNKSKNSIAGNFNSKEDRNMFNMLAGHLSRYINTYGRFGNVINTNNITELAASLNKMFVNSTNLRG